VSGYSLERWRLAEEELGGRILTNQVHYSLLDRSPELDLLPFAEAEDRIIIAFSPLENGLLSGRYDAGNRPTNKVRAKNTKFAVENLERMTGLLGCLREIGHAHSSTVAQIALAWVIRNPAVTAIPGASNVEQLEHNVAAADIELGDDEYQALQAASDRVQSPVAPRDQSLRSPTTVKHMLKATRFVGEAIWNDLWTSKGS
jgi:aryl-alcohol dehydrogenase-like predicted oxidoreductase